MQARCGIDALQIFDSWHNLCPPEHVWEYSLRWISQIIKSVPPELALIVYANASVEALSGIVRTGTGVIGVHHQADISQVRKQFPPPFGTSRKPSSRNYGNNPRKCTMRDHQNFGFYEE